MGRCLHAGLGALAGACGAKCEGSPSLDVGDGAMGDWHGVAQLQEVPE